MACGAPGIIRAGPGGAFSVSLASEPWRKEAGTALGALVSAVNTQLGSKRVQGFIMGCLDAGLWHRGGATDFSAANEAEFRRWLKTRYVDDAQLQKAWARPGARADNAAIPEAPDEGCKAYWNCRRCSGARTFWNTRAQSTADTILEFAGQIKGIAGRGRG